MNTLSSVGIPVVYGGEDVKNLVPVTSMIISAIEGQAPTHSQLLGGLLVIGAVSFASFAEFKLQKTVPS
jgi:drug/metabolite transporter (DMT)-like permease